MLEFATCARLYTYPDTPDGNALIPEVAVGFPRLSDGGKTQTVELKKTYRFHTGARLTATNFVAAFNRDANTSPDLASQVPGTGYLNEIVGAQAVMQGKATTISGVKAIDPYTLQIRTTRPVQDLPAGWPCRSSVRSPWTLRNTRSTTRSDQAPTTSTRTSPNRGLRLERNRFYSGPPAARSRSDRVDIHRTLRSNAAKRSKQDERDWCGFVPPSGPTRRSRRSTGSTSRAGSSSSSRRSGCSGSSSTTTGRRSRGRARSRSSQAINWAIDRPALAVPPDT